MNEPLDTEPPVTRATTKPRPDRHGVHHSDVTVTLTATDDLSGVARTEYDLDGRGWKKYTSRIKVHGDGRAPAAVPLARPRAEPRAHEVPRHPYRARPARVRTRGLLTRDSRRLIPDSDFRPETPRSTSTARRFARRAVRSSGSAAGPATGLPPDGRRVARRPQPSGP
ncbi:OmpL47-type beta-barrel domain-containing protein [Streptomyces adustus]|uniref:OmpL47-type beta-barrel domain-containing protein n=1 Tax=Streptomyces adustus TaxID=1609272 RepID=UPI0035E04E88